MNDKDKAEKNGSVGDISMDATLATGDVGMLDSLVAYGGGQRPRLRSSAAAVRPNGHPNMDS